MKTRSAWKAEQEENMHKKDPPRDVQSEILSPSNPIIHPARAAHISRTQGNKSNSTKGSQKSAVSIEARKKQLEFEASVAQAEIDRQLSEKRLIEKKLAADLAALECKSNRSTSNKSEVNSEKKVQQWLEQSSHVVSEHKNNNQDVCREGVASSDLRHLATAIQESNNQNKQIMSRITASKDLPQFYGDPLEWLPYKQAYDESTLFCKFNEAENMWRLRKSLRGEAKETVSSLLIGNTAPYIIIEALELRYGRPEIIINKITIQLKRIPPLAQNYHHEIVAFSIKIRNFVAAVQAIKQPDYLKSPEIVTSVLSKCPSSLLNKWADYYNVYRNSQNSKLELLSDFLYCEANKIASAGLSHIYSLPDYRKRPEERKPHVVLFGSKPDNIKGCKFCHTTNSTHSLPECARFKRAMRKDRWRFVRLNKLCQKCLLAPHNRDTCSAEACDIDGCGLPHHRLLHWMLKADHKVRAESHENPNGLQTNSNNDVLLNDSNGNSTDSMNCSTNDETIAHAISTKKSSVLLKVVPVNVKGPNAIISTHALLDDGATVSLISADIANQLNLHGHKQQLCIRGAWNTELTCESEIVNFEIITSDNKTNKLSAQKISELNLPIQKLSDINIQTYEHLKNIDKNIMCTENVKPQILIGQDNYDLIMPIKIIMGNKNEPCATLTPLGWCIHGICPTRQPHRPKSKECIMTTVARRQATPILAHCEFRQACIAAALADNAPGAAHTDECEMSPILPQVPTLTCASPEGAIHTDYKIDELHELVKQSFTFESIGVCYKPRKNKEEVRAIEIVENTSQIKNGKWEVGLPWKDSNAQMAHSYSNAFRRLKTVEKRMSGDAGFASRYKERVQDLLKNDYARKLELNENENFLKLWYLPHFGVDNPNKKKLRLVFDGAATSAGHSLNDYLLQGPDLLESLFGIMLRFRERRIGLAGDIKDMFLRVKIRPEDQHALRFLWRENSDEPVQKFAMTSLIFGANCSPFIAQHIKNKNALRFIEEMPEAVKAITKNHYMDDYIDCFDDIETAQKIMQEVSHIHKQGDFEIRNWTSNELTVCQNMPIEALSEAIVNFKTENEKYERTLGLLWYPKSDTFGFNLSLNRMPDKILKDERKPTKRELLRIVMSIFDIYGLLTPFTIQAKIIMQDIWKSNIDWNDEINDKQFTSFQNWIHHLDKIKEIRIPRWHFRDTDEFCQDTLTDSSNNTIELHLLCDASPAAYAAVAYWRVHNNNENVHVSFIASKSRVAPIKPVTIPRLELQAAVLACRLADTIRKETRIVPVKTFYWSDSTTVLHWIKNDTRSYKVFVANRLGEIDELCNQHEWNYVPTRHNIADVASKTNNYELYKDCEWFRGPRFLYKKDSEWSNFMLEKQKQTINDEVLEMVHSIQETNNEYLPAPDPAKFSSWLRLLRCTANILVFIEKCKKNKKAEINTNMLQRAEKLLLRNAQMQSFATEINLLKNNRQVQPNSRLRTLTPYLDECAIILVGGRIEAATGVSLNTKQPIILDGHHLIARLITKYYHEKSAHGTNEMVVNEIRQKYWLLNLRPTVRTVASKCLSCRIRKATPITPRMADLPPARLAHHQRAFTHCGVDLFGPMEITIGRRRERRYGVLFTCMTVRAIHIEVVPSLTTDSFIMALRRMACRRGWPQQIYSDNGTNLRGAERELKKSFQELDQNTIKDEMTNRGVAWTFISPISPHKGGAWERLIRSVKTALRVVLKERAPREETLVTLLTEVENIVNSRPLTHVSVDMRNMEALTPNHFLLGSSANLPIPGAFDDGDLYLQKMWRTAQRLTDLFWTRWVKEYLPVLIPRQKWYQESENLKLGDVVIIIDPNLPRNTWPKGIVEKVYCGHDGRVRTVDLRTKTGIHTRPVTRLALVPTNVSTTS